MWPAVCRHAATASFLSAPAVTFVDVIALLPAGLGLAAVAGVLTVVVRMHRAGRSTFSTHVALKVRPGDICPSCGAGVIRTAQSRFGWFLGCSMYKVTGCRAAWNLAGNVRIRGRNYGRVG